MNIKNIFRPIKDLAIGLRLRSPIDPSTTYLLCAVGPYKIGLISIKDGTRYSEPSNGNGGVVSVDDFHHISETEIASLIGDGYLNWEVVS
jgi:hypothetical protein